MQKQDMNPRLKTSKPVSFPAPCSGFVSVFQVEGAAFSIEEIGLGLSIRIRVTAVALAQL